MCAAVGSLRPEAIFLAGTDNMSTKDVLGLFKVYGPSCIEWINDSSCKFRFLATKCFNYVIQVMLYGKMGTVPPGP